MKIISSVLCAIGLGAVGSVYGAGLPAAAWLENLHYNASATAQWTDNLSRTSYQPTRKDALSYIFDLGAQQARQIAPSWLLDYGASLDLTAIPKYALNNTAAIGPHVGLQRKFGLGPLAPVLRLDTAYTFQQARINANQGGTAEAALRLSKRVTPYLKIAASGQWLEHYAESATFDIQQRTVSVEATWDITERWRLSASAGRLTGRIVANAAPQIWSQAVSGGFGPTIYNYYTSIPSEVTNAYGPGWVAYNVEAHANLWSAALAASLSEHTSVELRTNSVFVINKVGIRYPTESWALSVIHRF